MKSIILFSLIYSWCGFSQIKTIEYKAISVDTISSNIPGQFKDAILKNNKDLSNVTYTLQFNDSNMKFFANKPFELSANDYDMTLIMADIVGTTYRSNNSNEVFNERESFGNFKNFIATSKLITEWNITNEKKVIKGYNCIKATSILNIDYGDNDINKLYPITAWFCPDIKYSYGPRGIGGLPGLILELKQNLVTFYVSKIYLDEKPINILMPESKKIITTSKMYNDFEKE